MIVFSEKLDSSLDSDTFSLPPSSSTPLLPRINPTQINPPNNPRSLLALYLRQHGSVRSEQSQEQPASPTTSCHSFLGTMQLKPDSPPSYVATTSTSEDEIHNHFTSLPKVSAAARIDTDGTDIRRDESRHSDRGTQLMRIMSPYSHTGNNFLIVRRLTPIQGHWSINVDIPSSSVIDSHATADQMPPNLWLESANGGVDAVISLTGDGSTSNQCLVRAVGNAGDVNLAFKERSHTCIVPLIVRASTTRRGDVTVHLPPKFHGILRVSVSSLKRYWYDAVEISPIIQKRTKFISTKIHHGKTIDEYFVCVENVSGSQRLGSEDVTNWAGDVLEVEADEGQVHIYHDSEITATTWTKWFWKFLTHIIC